jgi:hypothetical protein
MQVVVARAPDAINPARDVPTTSAQCEKRFPFAVAMKTAAKILQLRT